MAVNPDLPGVLAAHRARIVVLGDVMVDSWTSGRCDRMCREAPVPVVDITAESFAPGGAGNTAANLAALGADTVMVAALGTDPAGDALREELRSAGVNTDHVVSVPGRITTTKRRITAGDQLMLRLDDGDHSPLPPEASEHLEVRLRQALRGCDALVVGDYGMGVLGPRIIDVLRSVRAEIPLLVVDGHALSPWRELRPDVVTPNAAEAVSLLDRAVDDHRPDFFDSHGDELRFATGAEAVVVTLDREGAVLLAQGLPTYRTWAQPAPDSQCTGAGDTFVAALSLAAACGIELPEAVSLAQAAADVVVRRPGTSVCTQRELMERLGRNDGTSEHSQLARIVAEHRTAGRRIVFTNGCFDVLHRGHVSYLNQARQLGDILIVAVNDDASVRRLKGPDRPVNTAADRAAVLAGLSCVDHVTQFAEDTPASLILSLKPDIYAKGGDYTPEMLPETRVVQSYGGQVRILDYVSDHSTTAVIDRIRSV
ncbi:rfaE bifunctional protein kinase chain/domain/rfaE bifunctional protein nucleotidyltransferase chain/domain [Kibdelosporangium banguiense]|uniref:Bifunctional protein HldE n=1 Tax=Kibdelosporangium banguiense TaxID=1365924 RepID=A0ABS4U3C4_9PSEU|nr:D-glycero-beta-D-manno-heptose 1-phosphate adenylyltransferase [Kibdelosporangium banguiense]MBP2330671.1 rfaE bifunctional protein kinase chain/domain/rfaE bifunctional protein nucleotidyltransferase chain/domain [Kibdelosporangium banguiense]